MSKQTKQAKKTNTKVLAQQKQRRRQWLTFVRMVRYGVNNFSRNAWLTIAATAVMTITLLIIMTTVAARQVLADTVSDIRSKVDMSVYIKNDTPDDKAEQIVKDMKKLDSVLTVQYISPKQAREEYIEANKDNPQILNALNESITPFPGTLRVNIADINNTSELEKFIKNNETLAEYLDARKPSFAGDTRQAIETIGRTIRFAERAGLVASVIFVIISSLIVFNTIRMAIFNRKEEIQMMKLIGADKSFIRGPFVVEAIVYGFIAAVIATVLGIVALFAGREKMMEYGVALDTVYQAATIYWPFVLLSMIVVGALIGIISSLLATRKYLRV